jgi:hypothetical protein
MSIFTWRLLAIAFGCYLLVVSAGYRFLWEPALGELVAIETAVSSLLGVGPRPLPIQQQSSVALVCDVTALLIGFILRVAAIGMVAALFISGRRKNPVDPLYASESRDREWDSFTTALFRDRRN